MIQGMDWSFHQHFNFMRLRFINACSKQVFFFRLNMSYCLIIIVIENELLSVNLCWDWNWRSNEIVWWIRVPEYFFWVSILRLIYNRTWFGLNKHSARMLISALSHWLCLDFLIANFMNNRNRFDCLHFRFRWWEFFFFIKVSFFIIIAHLSVKNVEFWMLYLILAWGRRRRSLIGKYIKVEKIKLLGNILGILDLGFRGWRA